MARSKGVGEAVKRGEGEDARRLRRLGFSVWEDRHVIPEDRIGGSANLLSLPGSQGGQEGFQFMGEKRRGWRTRRVLQIGKESGKGRVCSFQVCYKICARRLSSQAIKRHSVLCGTGDFTWFWSLYFEALLKWTPAQSVAEQAEKPHREPCRVR